jgi:hypothetical protein
MRKLLLLIVIVMQGLHGFAQRNTPGHPYQQINAVENSTGYHSTARTTATGDTIALSNFPAGDSTFVLYKEGTTNGYGYVTGTDSSNDHAFAERYYINGADSSVIVIGMFARFGGTVNPASTNNVRFDIWNESPPQVVSATYAYSSFPDVLLDTVTVPFTELGIGTTADTLKAFLFPTPTGVLQSSFFAGYSMNYIFAALNGDTIGLAASLNGTRTVPVYTAQVNVNALGDTSLDTVINVQNATMQSDNNWYDNYTQDDSIYNDLAIFPIVAIANATGISSIVKNGLTFYGNFPNPAVSSTNIKYALATNADVTIQVTDMTGRTLLTINRANVAPGEHVEAINTSAMSAGNYLYLIRTSAGGGIAARFTVTK